MSAASPYPRGSMRRSASEGPQVMPTQANLLRGRGELRQSRVRFDAKLPKVSPIVLPRGEKAAITRIGMEVVRETDKSGLFVSDIDRDPARRTAVSQFNLVEERQAHRSAEEEHVSHALLPGDRIRGIKAHADDRPLHHSRGGGDDDEDEEGSKKTMSQTAMLAALESATSFTSPRAVNLSVSRNIADVMAPSALYEARVPSAGETPQKQASKSASVASGSPEARKLPPKPPMSPGMQSQGAITTPNWRPSSRGTPTTKTRSASCTNFWPGATREPARSQSPAAVRIRVQMDSLDMHQLRFSGGDSALGSNRSTPQSVVKRAMPSPGRVGAPAASPGRVAAPSPGRYCVVEAKAAPLVAVPKRVPSRDRLPRGEMMRLDGAGLE
eukprot:TRINITY_DN17144_c0_g1_i1.p1 TRINITY_DN17144_c0_g1~~TRINITY_DN17144_c0_g1_i1.p1  ORF type:complete len:384 (-),score=73.77 TRINITY_DN17144_c0_g1_i1:542-1693(-)